MNSGMHDISTRQDLHAQRIDANIVRVTVASKWAAHASRQAYLFRQQFYHEFLCIIMIIVNVEGVFFQFLTAGDSYVNEQQHLHVAEAARFFAPSREAEWTNWKGGLEKFKSVEAINFLFIGLLESCTRCVAEGAKSTCTGAWQHLPPSIGSSLDGCCSHMCGQS